MALVQVVCSNICCNPKRAQIRVRRRITQAARIPGIHAGSEVQIPRYWRAWRQIMERHGMVSFGIGHEVPISLDPREWNPGYRKVHFAHGGKKDVSPARWINEVQAEHHDDEHLGIAVFACHPPNWGYPAARHKAGRSYEWRREHLQVYLTKLRHLVDARLAEGRSVVVVGDMNLPSAPTIHRGQVHLAHAGLDHVLLIPAPGYQVRRLPQRSVPASRLLGMDHPILVGRAHLERKS